MFTNLKSFLSSIPLSKSSLTIISLFVILVAIPLTVFLAQQQQELRQRATGACEATCNTTLSTCLDRVARDISGCSNECYEQEDNRNRGCNATLEACRTRCAGDQQCLDQCETDNEDCIITANATLNSCRNQCASRESGRNNECYEQNDNCIRSCPPPPPPQPTQPPAQPPAQPTEPPTEEPTPTEPSPSPPSVGGPEGCGEGANVSLRRYNQCGGTCNGTTYSSTTRVGVAEVTNVGGEICRYVCTDPQENHPDCGGTTQITGGACRDNPEVTPPSGYRWTALCDRSCDTPCPPGANNQSGWCFGFDGGPRCLRLDPIGVTTVPTPTTAPAATTAPTQPTLGQYRDVFSYNGVGYALDFSCNYFGRWPNRDNWQFLGNPGSNCSRADTQVADIYPRDPPLPQGWATALTYDGTGNLEYVGFCKMSHLGGVPWSAGIPSSAGQLDLSACSQAPTGVPTPTPTPGGPTVAPTLPPGAASLAFSFTLQGITPSSTPRNTSRQVRVEVFDTSNRPVGGPRTTTTTFLNGVFSATLDLGNFTPGSYVVKLKLNNTLRRLVENVTNIRAGTTTLPQITFFSGDVNDDNQLNSVDYANIVGCLDIRRGTPNFNCPNPTIADLNDDGSVTTQDLATLIFNFSRRSGD